MQTFRTIAGATTLFLSLAWATLAGAADRDTLLHFLEVTGFDVAITSMQQSAMDSPGITGDAPGEFGTQYTALAERVFDPDLMLNRAVDIMEAGMPEELVQHGIDFYASDLGKRLVEVENLSHVTPDEERYAIGEEVLTKLLDEDPGRVEDYQAMMDAIGGIDASIRAVTEVQVRYLLAAIGAGTLELDYSEEELRQLIAAQEPDIRRNLAVYSMLGAAYTYRDMSDEDIRDYRVALEEPDMKQIYELLNAIQFEVMAERYEVLASELAGLSPEQEL